MQDKPPDTNPITLSHLHYKWPRITTKTSTVSSKYTYLYWDYLL